MAAGDPDGVDVAKLDPVILDITNRRTAQKRKYHGELFISSLPADGGLTFLVFFQRDKATGNPKGIIAIDLEGFPVIENEVQYNMSQRSVEGFEERLKWLRENPRGAGSHRSCPRQGGRRRPAKHDRRAEGGYSGVRNNHAGQRAHNDVRPW